MTSGWQPSNDQLPIKQYTNKLINITLTNTIACPIAIDNRWTSNINVAICIVMLLRYNVGPTLFKDTSLAKLVTIIFAYSLGRWLFGYMPSNIYDLIRAIACFSDVLLAGWKHQHITRQLFCWQHGCLWFYMHTIKIQWLFVHISKNK